MTCPIVQAPMAGGGSGPALAAAVSQAGGLGFLAAGYKTTAQVAAEIVETRRRTSAPFGINVFVPSAETVDPGVVAAYRDRLVPEAERLEVELGEPAGGDDGWESKIEFLLADPVPVVSFTFGCPSREVADALRRQGSMVIVTVTTPQEAATAAAVADALCVQGTEAGGHRASFTDHGVSETTVRALLAATRQVTDLPLIAAGGLATGSDIADVLAGGAAAAQLGTAFLGTDESGAHPLHKAALAEAGHRPTMLTRAFSGRTARGLVNRFVSDHSAYAPSAYPHVHHLTSPLRRAAAERAEPGGMALWAGQGWGPVTGGPAADLVSRLADETGHSVRLA